MPLVIDIETRSLADIKSVGAWAYSLHPSTEVLCICILNTDSGTTWRIDCRENGWQPPTDFHTLIAHNINFEKAILLNKFNIDANKYTWIDTQDIAAYMGAPLSLEGAAGFLLGDEDAKQKDMEGKKIMYKICRPTNKKKGMFSEYTEDEFKKLMDYCEQDVMVSAELYKKYWHRIPEEEKETMQMTQRLNHRGIPVDVELVDRMMKFYQDACKDLEVPEGLVPSDVRRRDFLLQAIADRGYIMQDMTKASVGLALEDPELPDEVRMILETREIMTMASIKKLDKLKAVLAGDNRMRNGFQYHGSKTGRFAGRGVQPQNLPRGFSHDIDIIICRLMMGLEI